MSDAPRRPDEDEDDPNEVALAWQEEVRKRRQELEDGTAKGLSREEFMRRLREGT